MSEDVRERVAMAFSIRHRSKSDLDVADDILAVIRQHLLSDEAAARARQSIITTTYGTYYPNLDNMRAAIEAAMGGDEV